MSNNVARLVRIAALALLAATTVQASAQTPVPYTSDQCHRIRANIDGIFERYRGRISGELVDDLKEFSRRGCDRTVKIRMMAGTKDRDAVGELKIILAATE